MWQLKVCMTMVCKMRLGERNRWLVRSNSHPPDCESCLMSGLPTHWHAYKLPHCAIDSDAAFWYDYLSPAWMYQVGGILSLADAQEMTLDVGLLKKIVAGKKEFMGRSWENCYFQHVIKTTMTQQQHLKLIPHVQLWETLFFLLLTRHTIRRHLILLYGCTTWTLTKWLEKKLDGNYTRMLWAIFNKSWRQHPTKHQLYGHLPPITKTIQVRWTRHAGHCWRSKDELISDPIYQPLRSGRIWHKVNF